MKKELIFGVAYYDEYMPYERLDKDIEMMKAASINTVRIAESTWSTLEPEEGKYDFTHIDRVLEKMEKVGINVIVGTMTYAVPIWLSEKDDDVLADRKTGKARYGMRQNMNIMNQTYLTCARKTIQKLIEHVAGYKCVIGYQIDNETKHYQAYNVSVQEKFKKYLQEKYKTVENLNRTFGFAYWSNSIASWEELPDVRGTINASYACEYEKFLRLQVSEFLHMQAELVRKYKREDQFITHNFDFEWKKFGYWLAQDGYSYGVQPDCNHFTASKAVDIAGTDIYHPTQKLLTGAEIAFCGDEIRSLKNKNYLVLETQAQAFKEWLPFPGQLRLHAYSHLASGACGLMYWNWHSIHNSFETYWKGLLSHDMETNPTYEEACGIGKEWKEYNQELYGLKKENKVALMVSNETLTALKWFPVDVGLSYNDIVRWIYDSMYELNMECDIISTDMENLDQYQMIVTPALYCISEGHINRLKNFVENGGTLVSTFKSFVADENVTIYHDRQPHGMTDCFGINYNQFTVPDGTKIAGRECSYFMELLKKEGAETVYFYEDDNWGNYTAVSANCFGKGYAYYIGSYLKKDVLKEVLKKAARHAEIKLSSFEWPVIVRNGVNENDKKIHYVLYYSMKEQVIENPYSRVKDILTGQIYEKNAKIPLKPWDVKILKE